jgi:hypothetical protein
MKKKDFNFQSFVLVPEEWLEQIDEKLNSLMSRPHEQESKTLGDWISEEDAKQLLGRKTTWFYHRRIGGELEYTKAGRTTYYSRASINRYLEQNRNSAA